MLNKSKKILATEITEHTEKIGDMTMACGFLCGLCVLCG